MQTRILVTLVYVGLLIWTVATGEREALLWLIMACVAGIGFFAGRATAGKDQQPQSPMRF